MDEARKSKFRQVFLVLLGPLNTFRSMLHPNPPPAWKESLLELWDDQTQLVEENQ